MNICQPLPWERKGFHLPELAEDANIKETGHFVISMFRARSHVLYVLDWLRSRWHERCRDRAVTVRSNV